MRTPTGRDACPRGARRAGAASALVLVATLCGGATCVEPADVTITLTDAATGERVPGRVGLFRSSDGGGAVLYPQSVAPGSFVYANFFEMGAGSGTLRTDAGTYDLYATAGPEWSLDERHAVVIPGGSSSIELEVERVVDTAGYLAADLHVHTYASYDGQLRARDRVVTYLAEGIELLVPTDHDCIFDIAPAIADMGAGAFIDSLRGVEVTPNFVTNAPDAEGLCRSFAPGPLGSEHAHWGAFPLSPGVSYDTRLDEAAPAATVYDRVRALQSERMVVQLNHPHYDSASLRIDWFESDNANFQPDEPVPASYLDPSAPNAFLRKPSTIPGSTTQGIDFDSIEILGGGQSGDWLQNLADWFALLDQGLLKVGTASSDSHGTTRSAGYPRSWIAVDDDRPGATGDAELSDALLAGDVVGSTGPFLRFRANGAGIGALATAPDGSVRLDVEVSATPWIHVGEVWIVRNGQIIWSRRLDELPDPPVVRLQERIDTDLDADAWYVLGAGAPLPAQIGDPMEVPALYRRLVATNLVPLAFTNPIFVDRDGDGEFTAPGLDALWTRAPDARPFPRRRP